MRRPQPAGARHGRRASAPLHEALLLVGLLLAGPALVAGTPARADDEPPRAAPAAAAKTATPRAEIWTFRKEEDPGAVRTVDVTGLDEEVRERLLERLAADGYHRAPAPGPGQDLEADARALVAHGGRFPARSPVEGGRDAGGHAPPGTRAGPFPGVRPALLGAAVRLEALADAAWLRVLLAPEGSLARGLGLLRGDRILALDGRVPTASLLARLRGVEQAPGQLALRVLRRKGRTEDWTLTFARGPAPAPVHR